MNNQTPQCCQNTSTFLITYDIGSKFLVCDSCIKSSCWSRGIKEKISITKIGGGDEIRT